MQKSLPYQSDDFDVIWGAPVASKSRSGLAILARKGVVWAMKEVSFKDPVCLSCRNSCAAVSFSVLACGEMLFTKPR